MSACKWGRVELGVALSRPGGNAHLTTIETAPTCRNVRAERMSVELERASVYLFPSGLS